MILDRDGLVVLLEFSSKVEELSGEAVEVWESLTDHSHTPEEGYLRELVSGMGKVERTLSSLISLYPEEAVSQVKEELLQRGKL